MTCLWQHKSHLADFLPIDVHVQHESDDEEDSKSEVSKVLVKSNPSQLRASVDTLMNYSMIVGTVDLQGLTIKASRLVELEIKSCAKQKRMTDFFSINSWTIYILPVMLMKLCR